MTYKLYFTNGGEPSADERRALTEAYTAWEEARNGEGRVDEFDAAYALIEELMMFASIGAEEMDDDYRECDSCGDDVHTLSTRDWCDGCEEEAEHEIRDAFSDRVVARVMPASQTIKLLSNPGPGAPSFGQATVIRRTFPHGLGIAPEGVTGQPYPHVQIEGEQR